MMTRFDAPDLRQRHHARRTSTVEREGATAMRYLKASVVVTSAMLLALSLRIHGQAPQQDTFVWAPVPSTPNRWVAPNKPHTRLADLLAAHHGQTSWREPIVRDTL